ncbi:MAG: hypothetical protein ACOVLE_03350 [Pirellula staleyi]
MHYERSYAYRNKNDASDHLYVKQVGFNEPSEDVDVLIATAFWG